MYLSGGEQTTSQIFGTYKLDRFLLSHSGAPLWLEDLFARGPSPHQNVGRKAALRARRRIASDVNAGELAARMPKLTTPVRQREIPVLEVMGLVAPLGNDGGAKRTQMYLPGDRFLEDYPEDFPVGGVLVIDELAFRVIHIIAYSQEMELMLRRHGDLLDDVVSSGGDWRVVLHGIGKGFHVVWSDVIGEMVERSLTAEWSTGGFSSVRSVRLHCPENDPFSCGIPEPSSWQAISSWTTDFQEHMRSKLRGSRYFKRFSPFQPGRVFPGNWADFGLATANQSKDRSVTGEAPENDQRASGETVGTSRGNQAETMQEPKNRCENQNEPRRERTEILDGPLGGPSKVSLRQLKDDLTAAKARLEFAQTLADPNYVAICSRECDQLAGEISNFKHTLSNLAT